MAVLAAGGGREAISEYHTMESFTAHTLLAFHPKTGRTHQVRLHCAFLGCPIVGDTIYGRRIPTVAIDRHFLHAARLSLVLPHGSQPTIFEAELPADLKLVLEQIKRSGGT
jgi:23S rRNA pseudouridine1911/1915/1917 synthase